MQRIVFTRLMLMGALLPLLGGCELLRLNEARGFAVTTAGYAGRFRIAHGRWPDIRELEEFTCMRGRADGFGLALRSCDDVVRAPYLTQLAPKGADLRVTLLTADRRPLCRLTVRAPHAAAAKDAFPMVVIETSVFSCRGDRKPSSVDVR